LPRPSACSRWRRCSSGSNIRSEKQNVKNKAPAGSRDVLSHACRARKSARGAQVDLALGERGPFLVSRLFLLQRLLQDTGDIVAAKLPGPRDQAAAERDFVMLSGLGCV
jgi:hypothetical protein